MSAWERFKSRWAAAGEAIELERKVQIALGVASYVNRLERECDRCGTPWISNGPGVPDCACTLGKREARRILRGNR